MTFGTNKSSSRWWFQTFFELSPLLGEMIQFDEQHIFKWVGEKPPTSHDPRHSMGLVYLPRFNPIDVQVHRN